MNEQLVARIRECPTLPTLPAVAIQVLDLAAREEANIAEIARVISADPALSSKILRTVNSSFYAQRHSISTITHALVILGLQSVKTLVLGFSLITNFGGPKGGGFKHMAYWRRSVYAATAARILAARVGIVQQEEAFLAALLMDIGALVLDQVLGAQYSGIHERASAHRQLADLETQGLGMNHAEVAALMAQQWHLPPVLSVPMSMHHNAQAVSDPALRRLSDLVCLAGQCADIFVEEPAGEAITIVRRHCHENYGISEDECDEILDSICTRTAEVAPLLDVTIAVGTSYDSILKKANEVLVDLTLRTQLHAATLQKQNLSLQEQAATDALTGLANRATFDRCIAEQFAAAVRNAKPLALVFLDIDRFKLINDRHGHAAGDQVLRAIGRLLRAKARAADLAARYGGEEMMLVLPGMDKAAAAHIAECIRRAIAARPLACGKESLSLTVSIGVAALEAGLPFTHESHLVKAADLALYAAKHAGRNCVRVFSIKCQAPARAAA